MISIIFYTTGLEQQKARLEEELNRVADEVNDCINENAKVVQNQDEYERRYAGLVTVFNKIKSEFNEVTHTVLNKKCRCDEVNEFIEQLQNQELLKEFNSNV